MCPQIFRAPRPATLRTLKMRKPFGAHVNTVPIAIASFVFCGLALRIIFWTGPTGSDDVAYFTLAAKFLSLQPFSEIDFAVRPVFLILIGTPAVLLNSMSAGIALNVLFSLLNDLTTIWIAYRLFGKSASMAAAFAMAFCGVNILYPSTFLPDTLLTTLFLAVFLQVERAVASEVTSLRWMLVAGLATGAAYSVKETGILLVPPVALFVLLKARQRKAAWSPPLACYAIGILGFVLIEATVSFLYTGHFFYRQVALAQAAMSDQFLGKTSLLRDYLREAAYHVVRFGSRHIIYGTIAIIVAVPLWIAAIRRVHLEMLIALIGGFSLLYLLVGTMSLTELVLVPYQPRYCQPIIPFAALALAKGYSAALTKGVGARLIAYSVGVLIVGPSILAAPLVSGNMYNEPYYRNLAAVVPLLDSSGKPVFLIKQDFESLRHFLKLERYLNVRPSPEGLAAAGYYVVNPTRVHLSDFADKIAARGAFQFQADTRTYRRYFPTLELPDFTPISRRQVVVLEKPL